MFRCATITLATLLVCTILSCVRYIDRTRTPRLYHAFEGQLVLTADSNHLIYRNSIPAQAHKYVCYPLPFSVNLPKGLITYEMTSMDFKFDYSNKQYVLMQVDYWAWDLIERDTSYSPSNDEIYSFLDRFNAASDKNFFDLEPKHNRKQWFVQYGRAKILLFNIRSRNFRRYVSTVKTFKFL